MKKSLYITLIAILICVVGTVVFLIIAPAEIPVHYNFAGEADRIGSKFEMLMFPFFAVGLGVFFLLAARFQRKKGEAGNERVMLISGAIFAIAFTLLSFYMMYKAIRYGSEGASAE